jgi:hypothetical protein
LLKKLFNLDFFGYLNKISLFFPILIIFSTLSQIYFKKNLSEKRFLKIALKIFKNRFSLLKSKAIK